MFTQIQGFLEAQKKRLLKLDEADESTGYLTKREFEGGDFTAMDKSGRKIGLMEMLYSNTIEWIMAAGTKNLYQEFQKLSAPGVLTEATSSSSNIQTFTTALLPAVRRIYNNLIARDLISVQSLPGPAGYIYWIDRLFADAHGTISADDRVDQNQDETSYGTSSEGGAIRGIDFKVSSKKVETINKKVLGNWSLEAEQDLRAQWHMDLEGEISTALADVLAMEMDRMVINDLSNGAGAGNVNWSKNPPSGDTTTSAKKDYYSTLYWAICEAGSKVYAAKRMTPTWLLCNAETFYLLERLENFSAEGIENQEAAVSRRFVGTLNRKYHCYVDPDFTDNRILVGIRSLNDWRYAIGYLGIYIPLFLSPKYTASSDFSAIYKGAQSRFAHGVIPDSSTETSTSGVATVTITSS